MIPRKQGRGLPQPQRPKQPEHHRNPCPTRQIIRLRPHSRAETKLTQGDLRRHSPVINLVFGSLNRPGTAVNTPENV
jgi:hypothetical protein